MISFGSDVGDDDLPVGFGEEVLDKTKADARATTWDVSDGIYLGNKSTYLPVTMAVFRFVDIVDVYGHVMLLFKLDRQPLSQSRVLAYVYDASESRYKMENMY